MDRPSFEDLCEILPTYRNRLKSSQDQKQSESTDIARNNEERLENVGEYF